MFAKYVVYPTPLIKSCSVERKSFPSFSNVFLLQNHYSQTTRLVLDGAIWIFSFISHDKIGSQNFGHYALLVFFSL